MRPHRLPAILSALLLSSAPLAQEAPGALEPAPDAAPTPPERVQSGEVLEPEVRIIRGQDEVITEYRLNGRLYMIRVVPQGGYPYYLVDADGDGVLETTRGGLSPGFLVPSWVLFRW